MNPPAWFVRARDRNSTFGPWATVIGPAFAVRERPAGAASVGEAGPGRAGASALGSDSPEALTLAGKELERAHAGGYERATGIALRARGLLLGDNDGIDALRAALIELDRSPGRLEYARTLFHLGSALRRQGHRAAAREPLRESLDLAATLGAERLTADATAELAAAGGRPRRRRLTGVESLTPTELRIAQMAANDRSNKEIAQALFVSRKTIEMHLSHAYRKLDIASRSELPHTLRPDTR